MTRTVPPVTTSSSDPSGQPSTELRNPRTTGIDRVSTAEALRLILAEDVFAVHAALAVSEALSRAVDAAAIAAGRGGRIHYFGAGASGRLAMLDATEMSPTFGVESTMFEVHFPGGAAALADSSIDLEDESRLGASDAEEVRSGDFVLGVTASGTTPYVAAALRRSREVGATTVLLSMWPQTPLAREVDIAVLPDTGPEALTGSTRLKAGTATKVMLNAFSTTLMIRLGRTHSNLMVGMRATNAKLDHRAVHHLAEASGCEPDEARRVLAEASGEVRVALVMLLSGSGPADARAALARAGSVAGAVSTVDGETG